MESNQQDNDVIEINLVELIKELWDNKGMIFLSALTLMLMFMLVTKVFITPKYTSTTKLYVLTKQDSNTVTNGDLQAGAMLTKDYMELIKSRQVTESVINDLNLDITDEELLGKMDVTTPTDTRVITIKVSDDDPYEASKIANAVRNEAAEHIQKVMNTEAVNVVEQANIPDTPDSPSMKKNAVIGAFLGAVAAIAIVLINYMSNDTIKTSEDVERYLNLSTMGVIPLEDGNQKKKKNKKARRK
ncbi:protein-tyrosine kinase [Blautia liquoris]|jgi:capsular polysaccharide biosynthesis protein|uniref:Protein-tyrosine kinase n=1 Tax=Blautia liquoris TaxID=2779518 RepID=A0A7M2RHN4_9FIRM|nr:Wzz/FepE/Etk N-terminal domain-containing protein [Blautia liquoris]QOV18882.1 protein-tyrosine kinase [Blautia liquoris]